MTVERRSTLCHAASSGPVRRGMRDTAGEAAKHSGAGAEACDDAQQTGICQRPRATPTEPDAGHPHVRSNGQNVIGAQFETRAMAFLQRQRLRFVARNVRCRRGELDLVMREPDGTLVFVEVRARTRRGYDGAAASVGWRKRRRLVAAAQYFLARCTDGMPACRFDVVAFDSGRLVWLRDAFRADDC